jgi:hypothetical protein
MASLNKDYVYCIHNEIYVGRNSVVGVETRYGLGGLAIESRSGVEVFRTSPDRPWGPPTLVYSGYLLSFLGVKRPGCGVELPV